MRTECLSSFQPGLQSRKNARPSFRVLGIRRVVVCKTWWVTITLTASVSGVKFYLHSRHHLAIADAEFVFDELRPFHAQHLSGQTMSSRRQLSSPLEYQVLSTPS